MRPLLLLPRPALTASALALLLVTGCAEQPEAPPPSCELGLVEALDEDRAMEHLQVLSAEIGPRVASSPAEREAAEYLAAQFEAMGYEVEIQEFPRTQIVAHLHDAAGNAAAHPAAGRIQDTGADEYPLLTPDGGLTGPVVDCAGGGCPAEVDGAIALLTSGGGSEPGDRLRGAADAGAVAAIIHGEDWRRFLVSVDGSPIPFVTVNAEAAESLRARDGSPVTLGVDRYYTSQNVIATRTVEERPDAPVVVFSAHYDSVEQSPGANDNGSGTVGMLELARVLAEVPTEFELRFAAVGAEEVGLVGSRYYVSQLPEDEVERIVANFNTDMIGTAGEDQVQLYVNTLDGDNLVARSARSAREALGLPEEMLRAPYQRGASDHVAFHDVGIPAANFIWRDPETADLEPWYHHPRDIVENVSPERLRTAMDIALGAALQVICEAPVAEPESQPVG